MEEKRWKLAETFFQRSIGIEPDDAKTHYLLAKVELELNELPEAQAEIGIALKFKSDQPEFQALEQEIRARQTGK